MRYPPPPPPRHRRPPPPLVDERPFDPEAPREHYARAHHFAINAEDRLPGVRRFMVIVRDAGGNRALAAPGSYGFMSLEEAGAWIRSNAPDTPVEVRGYNKGSDDDPRMWADDGYAPNARFQAGPVDEHAATELVMYIENTADLSPDGPRGQGNSVLLNALRKWRKGTYDPALAVRLFEYLTETGAKRYAQEFAEPSRWSQMFTAPTRRAAARQLEASFRSAVERGEYDDVDTRIQRR